MAEDLGRPLLDPTNFNSKGIDLEHLPLEQVLQQLKTSQAGLTKSDADIRFKLFGPNKLEEIHENIFVTFLSFMWNPLSWVMEVAAMMALVLANGGGEVNDWQDFAGILCLLVINSTISFITENNAGSVTRKLMASLASKTKVLRDGIWQEEDAAILVPGDIISIKMGDIIPAAARLLKGDSLKIDQSTITGELLPVTKKPGDVVFSGSTCKEGEIEAVVIATGIKSFFVKATHLIDSTEVVDPFQQVLTSIGIFCICSIAVGMVVEIIIMFAIQHRSYREGINNLLVLLIGGLPIAMPTMLNITLAIGSHTLSQQGIITKSMRAIEGMAGMDILCSEKTGTLTSNYPTIDRKLIEVLDRDMDRDTIVLLAARASRLDNQGVLDVAITNMLADPREARANITEVHFMPYNSVDKRTTITYTDYEGNWYRASKGDTEQILSLSEEKNEIAGIVHSIVDKYAERGLRSNGVAIQEVPEKTKDSPGGPWKFCGLLPIFDPLRPGTAVTLSKVLTLGVNVKMITGDELAIAKETGRRLGIGTNMYPASSLLGRQLNEHEELPVDELIEKADGFAGVFPEHKYQIVKILKTKKHIVGVTGDDVEDVPALKKADIGIAVADAADAAKSASDIVLTDPGINAIISAVLTSREIIQKIKNCTIYAVSTAIQILLGFMLLALIWEYDFPPFMVIIIAILNFGTVVTISQDQVKPSPTPNRLNLNAILAHGIVIGTYLALVTCLFYWVVKDASFFETCFNVRSISDSEELSSAVFLQVSIISQSLIFVTRTQSWSFLERPDTLALCVFAIEQLVATLIAVYANVGFPSISGIGWGWAGAIWLYSLIFYMPLDLIKFCLRYIWSS